MPRKILVRNIVDLSDDEGYSFRFHCDRCFSAKHSSYQFSPLLGLLRASSVYRDISGFTLPAHVYDPAAHEDEKEAAFAIACEELGAHFRQCPQCQSLACGDCLDERTSHCKSCRKQTQAKDQKDTNNFDYANSVRWFSAEKLTKDLCPGCQQNRGEGKFCRSCGMSTRLKVCRGCSTSLSAHASFCGECGLPCLKDANSFSR